MGGTDGEPGGGYHLAGRRHRGCDERGQAEPPIEPPRWGALDFNATVVTGERPSAVAAPFDSVWIDFSKGLGAPVGAALAGDEDFIDGAWRWKQRLGGSMRQAGVLAAAASYALAHHVDRLAEDHVRARRLADALSEMDGVELGPAQVETNIVIFGVGVGVGAGGQAGAAAFLSLLLEKHGVRGSIAGPGRVRFVTHLDVDDADIDIAVMAVRDVIRELGRREPA